MLKYLIEFIGTFFFILVILSVQSIKNKILIGLSIGLGIASATFIGHDISGGHFNPVVSILMWISNKLSTRDTMFYIISQLLGGILALYLFKYTH